MDPSKLCKNQVPPGVKLFSKLHKRDLSFRAYKTSVLVLTFIAYALFHASRKPASIVKNVLSSEELPQSVHPSGTPISLPWPLHMVFIRKSDVIHHSANASLASIRVSALESGWAPFDGQTGRALLGDIDVTFLASYSLGMYFAGHLADRLCLRWFLAAGMVGSGIGVCCFGLAYWWNVHWLGYFLVVQIVTGLFQSSGWPSVVTVLGNWFGKGKRGLIMGIWNSHTSIGNICGSLMASAVLKYGWGWSFLVPGITMVAGGALIFLFLVVNPEIVGLPSPYSNAEGSNIALKENGEAQVESDEEKGVSEASGKASADFKSDLKEDEKTLPLLEDYKLANGSNEEAEMDSKEDTAVGFLQAWAIPGVASFALCLFFAKLVVYTFLYWLPFYIRHTEIQGESFSDATAGNLSTIFDVGGILGGILAGHLSDRLNVRAIVAASFIYGALPALLLYRIYGCNSFWLNVILLFVAGVFVNAPYALITTAVSADLGTHESLKGNSRALATVTAIIDATGSVGAAIGPMLTGYLSKTGWNSVFAMLLFSATSSGLLLTRLVAEELKEYAARFKSPCRKVEAA